MIDLQIGRPPWARIIRFHPAWLLAPIGLLGCLVIGLAMGYFQSMLVAAAIFGGAVAALWLLMVVAHPEWALLFYAFAAVNLNGVDLPVPLGGVRVSPDIVLTSLLIVGTLLRLLHTRRPLGRLPISAPYLVFLAVPFITTIWSPVPFQSLKGSFRFVGYYALMWLAVDVIRTRPQVLRLVTVIVLSPLIAIAVGFYQLATGGGQLIWAGEQYNRVYGLAGGPFTLAYYLVLIIPLLLVFFLEGKKLAIKDVPGAHLVLGNRLVLALLILGSTAALMLTFIRGAWIALTVALFLLGLVRYRFLLVTLPVALAGLLWAYAPAQNRITQTLDPTSTLFGRLRLWQFAWEWIISSPLVGVGMKAFEFHYILAAAPYSLQGLDRRERFLVGNRPHNEIIGFLLDVGVIGTVALIVALAIIVRLAVRIYRQATDDALRLIALAFLISSAGMFVGAMGDNVFSQPTVAVYFWLMAGLIMAIDRHLVGQASPSEQVPSASGVGAPPRSGAPGSGPLRAVG